MMRAKDEILHLNDWKMIGVPRMVSENQILKEFEIARHCSCNLVAASVAAFTYHQDVCFVMIVAFGRNENMFHKIWNEIFFFHFWFYLFVLKSPILFFKLYLFFPPFVIRRASLGHSQLLR